MTTDSPDLRQGRTVDVSADMAAMDSHAARVHSAWHAAHPGTACLEAETAALSGHTESPSEPPALDAAWAEVVARLPDGWYGPELFTVARDRWIARCWNDPRVTDLEHGEAETPLAALAALSDALAARLTPASEEAERE